MPQPFHIPIWKCTVEPVSFPALKHDARVDVCIVGAGITGMTTAYLLAREGKSVMVLDDGLVGWGETGHTSGHLCSMFDDRYFYLAEKHGEDGARLAAESHATAIDLIEAIVAEEKIDCDFERLDGYLFVPAGDSPEPLKEELDAAHAAGLTDVQWVERAPFTTFATGPALRFPRQAQFHSLKYLAALAAALTRLGGAIHTGTHVDGVEDGAPATVHAVTGATVTADTVILATNVPINDRFAIHTKQEQYRSYVIGAQIAPSTVPKALYWDTLDPYHYVRLHEGEGREILIIGGEDHKTGQEENEIARFEALERWARERFPTLGDIEYCWAGQIVEPLDGLAFIGRNPGDENVYIATGDSGNGLTHGTVAAMIFTDVILGRKNAWAGLYDPSRKMGKEMREYVRANLNEAGHYWHWLTPGDVKSVDEIPHDCGAIMREGLHKVAVYRDEHGFVHKLSATCPHLGCIVTWNNADRSWDCPCHGSRFEATGKVVNGPANRDLDVLVSGRGSTPRTPEQSREHPKNA